MDTKIFHYAILNYQKSLYDRNDITPLAVIVYSSEEKKFMVRGISPDIDGLSKYSSTIVDKIKDNIVNDLSDALNFSLRKEDPSSAFFERLQNNLKWNLFISPQFSQEGFRIEIVASELFYYYIKPEPERKLQNRHRVNVEKRDTFDIQANIQDDCEVPLLQGC